MPPPGEGETQPIPIEDVLKAGRLAEVTGESPLVVAEMLVAKREYEKRPQGVFDPLGLEQATKHAAGLLKVRKGIHEARDAGETMALDAYLRAERQLWNSFPILIPREYNTLDTLPVLRKKLGRTEEVADLPFPGGMVTNLSSEQYQELVPKNHRQLLVKEPRILFFEGPDYHVTSRPLIDVLSEELARGSLSLDRLDAAAFEQFSAEQQQKLKDAATRWTPGKPA